VTESGAPPEAPPTDVVILVWARPGEIADVNVTTGAGVCPAHMLVACDALREVASRIPEWDAQVAAGTPEVGPGIVFNGQTYPGDHMLVVIQVDAVLQPRVILGCGSPVTPGLLGVAAHLLLLMGRFPISQSLAARAAQRAQILVPGPGAPRMQA
jgi:hypothetical protein